MYITLLFVAAFLYFIADRKIRGLSLFGMFSVELACLPLCYEKVRATRRSFLFWTKVLKHFGLNPGRENMDRLSMVLVVFLSLILILLLMLITKFWSRELFGDGPKYEKRARVLIIAASSLILLAVLWLFTNESIFPNDPYDFNGVRYYNWLLIVFRTSVYRSYKNNLYGMALLLVAVLPPVIVFWKDHHFRKEDPRKAEAASEATSETEPSLYPAFSTIGIGAALFGILSFITIADTMFPRNHRLRYLFYDHQNCNHDYSALLCTLVLMALLAGIVFLILGLIRIIKRKQTRKYVFTLVFSILVMVISIGCFRILLCDAIRFIRSGHALK